MPRFNRSMPTSAVIPVLGYRDVREAVAWLTRAFGFEERLRISDQRSQLAFGGGAVRSPLDALNAFAGHADRGAAFTEMTWEGLKPPSQARMPPAVYAVP